MTKTVDGTKTPFQYAYDHADGYTDGQGIFVPCGLVTAIATPTPGSVSGSGTQVVTRFSYDVSGRGSQAMGSLGLGNLVSMNAPGNNAMLVNGVDQGITNTFTYGPTPSIGLPLSVAVTDNQGNVLLGDIIKLRYDTQGQTVAVVDALGNETDSNYNENGGTVSLGNQVQITTLPATGQTGTGHSGSASTYLYPGGPLMSTTIYDESNHAVRQVVTTRDRESEILAVSGSTEPVSYTYDALYRLRTLTDGGGHTTTYFYNVAGYLAQVVYPGAQATPPTSPLPPGSADTVSFTGYDPNGNVLSRVDGRNQTTAYSYNDPESMLTDITYPSGTIGGVHFNYDQCGRRGNTATNGLGMTDGTGSQAYTYDDNNILTRKNVTWTGLPAKTISYGFFPNSSRASMTADGQAFSYGYDAVGRMTGLTNPFSEASSWIYKPNGWLATCALNNSTGSQVASTVYTYNPLGQVSELLNKSGAGAMLSDYKSMTYDAVGNRTSLTASVPGAPASYSGTTSYGYDYGQTANPALNRSQVTGETSTRGTGTLNYGYDGGTSTGPGNPTSFKGTTNSFNADNQMTGTIYGYDGAGNPTTYRGAALSFDPENRMTGDSAGSQTNGYDGDGLRVLKQSGGNTTYFLYDGTQPVMEYNSSGMLLATNTLAVQDLVSRHASTGSTFYTFDEQRNVSQRLSSTGTIVGSDLYDAYGGRAGTTAQGDPFGYRAQAGYYTDLETGLILCAHRYYDPAMGKWLTRDPISYRGGINLYEYVGNGPTHWVDPSGYDAGWAGGPGGRGGAWGGPGDEDGTSAEPWKQGFEIPEYPLGPPESKLPELPYPQEQDMPKCEAEKLYGPEPKEPEPTTLSNYWPNINAAMQYDFGPSFQNLQNWWNDITQGGISFSL